MPTDKQLQANRRNARKSTGPRTAQGKAASAANALKTGLYAKSIVIPGEDPAELQTLTTQYLNTYRPTSPDERALIDTLIANEWLLRRLRRCEAQLWTRSIEGDEERNGTPDPYALASAFCWYDARLALLQRRLSAAERSYHRALTDLQRLQQARRSAEPAASKSLPRKANFPKLASFPQVSSHAPEPSPLTSDPAPLYAETCLSNVENELRL
jgi:hypothetical protein